MLTRGLSVNRGREQGHAVSAFDERPGHLLGEDFGTARGRMGQVLPVEDQDAHGSHTADEMRDRACARLSFEVVADAVRHVCRTGNRR